MNQKSLLTIKSLSTFQLHTIFWQQRYYKGSFVQIATTLERLPNTVRTTYSVEIECWIKLKQIPWCRYWFTSLPCDLDLWPPDPQKWIVSCTLPADYLCRFVSILVHLFSKYPENNFANGPYNWMHGWTEERKDNVRTHASPV